MAPAPSERGSRPGAPDLATLFEALPAAVLVVDGMGTVTWCTEAAAAMVGRSAGELWGRSVLEFVTPESAWAYAAAVALAADYADVVMGPMRVALRADGGDDREIDLWATNRLDDPTVAGIVCLLQEQTTASGLTDAVALVSEGAPLADVVARVERAMAGHPVVAEATVRLATARAGVPALDAVVERVARSGVRELFGDAAALAEAGLPDDVAALWVEPIPGATGADAAALVLRRRRPGNPSPNQLRSIVQGAAIVDVARRMAREESS